MISSEQMKNLEKLSSKYGVTTLRLMENAGYGMFKEIKARINKYNKFLVICGTGNNGGDGFVLAKYLYQDNYDVSLLFIGQEHKLKKESGYNYLWLKQNMSEIFTKGNDYKSMIENSDVIVDAMLGTGIKGKLRKPVSYIIDLINHSGKRVVCVDIPSGLDPDTGEIHDKAVKPTLTLTLHDKKPGLKNLQNIIVVDIGIPDKAVQELNLR